MAKTFTPKILTANTLRHGDVVYWNETGNWVGAFEDALYLDSELQANQLLALAEQQQDVIVGPYLTDAALGADNKPQPSHFREIFRTNGPSNYPHGKQTET